MSDEGKTREREQLPQPQELVTVEDLQQFFHLFKKANGLVGDSKRDGVEERSWAKRKVFDLKNWKEVCLGMKDGDQVVAIVDFKIISEGDEEESEGYLSMLAVEKEYQGRGAANQMTKYGLEVAKARGCGLVKSDVLVENKKDGIKSLGSLFKAGFVLETMDRIILDDDSDGNKKLVVVWRGDDADKNGDEERETQSVNFKDVFRIRELLADGWVGVRALTDGKGKNEIVFEKTEKGMERACLGWLHTQLIELGGYDFTDKEIRDGLRDYLKEVGKKVSELDLKDRQDVYGYILQAHFDSL